MMSHAVTCDACGVTEVMAKYPEIPVGWVQVHIQKTPGGSVIVVREPHGGRQLRDVSLGVLLAEHFAGVAAARVR